MTPLEQLTPSFTKRIHNVYAEQATITNDFKAYVKSLDFANEEIENFFNLALEVDDFTVIQYLSRLLDRNIHKIAVGDLKSTAYPTPSCTTSSSLISPSTITTASCLSKHQPIHVRKETYALLQSNIPN